jgi:hypothetical protein
MLIRANGLPLPANQVMFSLAILAFCLVGTLIATNRPDHAIGWIFCVTAFVALGAFSEQYAMYALVTRPGALPTTAIIAILGIWLGNVAWGVMLSFTVLLFPTGRLPSSRWRPAAWFAAGAIAFLTIGYALSPGEITDRTPGLNNPFGLTTLPNLHAWVATLEAPLTLTAFLISVVSLVVRYRWAQTGERQQIKWFVYTTIFMVAVMIGNEFYAASFGDRLPDFVFGALLTLLPVSVGIAILRYRLFDIDLIIRRTLLYTLLSLTLALLYFGSVLILETLVRSLTGQGRSQWVTVLSTLAIAALFTPLRRQMQDGIDRRFYRRKYDAEQVLAAFGETVRNETDLHKLSEQLMIVVQKTMQPTRISLCLKSSPTTPIIEVAHEANG